MIQLDAEEKERYKGCHIYLDFESGLCTFPVSFYFSFFWAPRFYVWNQ